MKRAPLPAGDRKLLDDDLALQSELQSKIDALEFLRSRGDPRAIDESFLAAGEKSRVVVPVDRRSSPGVLVLSQRFSFRSLLMVAA